MTDTPRLIEFAFPLEQTSIDSVHEKNVRHGHISTLHIWPARRPLAACRAALIATLLPDPGSEPKPEGMSDAEWEKEIRLRRQKLSERIGGKAIETVERKKMPNGSVVERKKKQTEGGVLHWLGTEPSSGGRKKIEQFRRELEDRDRELEWFRQEIRKAYGGRAPRVLDPFAGGGAIPLEAMRLGCEVTAADINPVAWFILKCTLEYPQKLAGKTMPLPEFILEDDEFMTAFYKAHPHLAGRTKRTKAQEEKPGLFDSPDTGRAPRADLAWHVRAWGRWVLSRARRELAPYYPTYADFEPLDLKNPKPYERQPMRLVPLRDDGTADIEALNAELSTEYLADRRNPRWVAKPTVAYLWARTVICKNCRATIPLLKTRWLARTPSQRVLLNVWLDDGSPSFSIERDVAAPRGNNAQRRESDKRLGVGTMSRSGAKCINPTCGSITTQRDLQVAGTAGEIGRVITAVAVDGRKGKEFRLPTPAEILETNGAVTSCEAAFAAIPYGLPDEKIVEDAKRNTWCVTYGYDRFYKLFTQRQLIGLGVLVGAVRSATQEMRSSGYPPDVTEAVTCYLSAVTSRLLDFFNAGTQWKLDRATINHLFVRWALSVSWDFAEGNLLGTLPGSYSICLEKVTVALDVVLNAERGAGAGCIALGSSVTGAIPGDLDAIVTDPPYYDSIGYAVLMDFFYVWLRRQLWGLSDEFDAAFTHQLTPKWNEESSDGELVDDASRHGGDAQRSKDAYETGMATVFERCAGALTEAGRLVVVFAHKNPLAWESLVAAIIRAGFAVDGSWPIQTEQANRTRALSSSALASSVWLVCRKRPVTARAGWDQQVLTEMRATIAKRLRDFWDAGVRGPDFVWAATGPGLEAFSRHPVVKKANDPGQTMSVTEFLVHVRRMVVEFVIGQVLTGERGADTAAVDRLDAPTAYYLLHRHDFGMDDAPAGACILYATACGIGDRQLESDWDLITHSGTSAAANEDVDEAEADEEEEEESGVEGGSKIRLKTWGQRKQKGLGYEAPRAQPVPLIDRIHRLMHLWRSGDQTKVDQYLDDHGLRGQELFRRVLQSLIELSVGEERSLLESISNHVQAKGVVPRNAAQIPLATVPAGGEEDE